MRLSFRIWIFLAAPALGPKSLAELKSNPCGMVGSLPFFNFSACCSRQDPMLWSLSTSLSILLGERGRTRIEINRIKNGVSTKKRGKIERESIRVLLTCQQSDFQGSGGWTHEKKKRDERRTILLGCRSTPQRQRAWQ
mmetsp:Transcript_1750/g.3745  ORF Transcript_1750/g.3745 Transcript_1750/m.3745 type:complete len:138 (-) Transcript_1750:97-510(-)